MKKISAILMLFATFIVFNAMSVVGAYNLDLEFVVVGDSARTWLTSGCSTFHFDCVTTSYGLDTTSYVYMSGLTRFESFTIAPKSNWHENFKKVNYVDVKYYAKEFSLSYDDFIPYVAVDGTVYSSSTIATDGSWDWYTVRYTTNPDTGLAWTQAEVEDLVVGARTLGYFGYYGARIAAIDVVANYGISSL